MGDYDYPDGCSSGYEGKHNNVQHYFGCLGDAARAKFFNTLSEKTKKRIEDEKGRIARLRSSFEAEGHGTEAGKLLLKFKTSLAHWRKLPHPSVPAFQQNRPLTVRPEDDEYLKATMIYYTKSRPNDPFRPYDHPIGQPEQFPNQKIPLKTLLYEKDKKKNPLMMDCEQGMIRYFHLPANNMEWVEEAIARYYNEDRPDLNSPYQKPRKNEQSKTRMLLRPQFWRGLQHGDRIDLPVHSRHMRPRSYIISTDPFRTEEKPNNVVLFMPYLHWETDRKRQKSAEIIKRTRKSELLSVTDVVVQATTIRNVSTINRATTDDGLEPITTTEITRPIVSRKITESTIQGQKVLGQVLLRAAGLMEAMDYRTDELLVEKYLNNNPPLHPRRTLDQSYYWTLKDTYTRDRDQVVYRSTARQRDQMHYHPEDKRCEQCLSNIKRVPRVVMVDQLWMWVLDENTIITFFPRRFGRNKGDASAVQKCIRTRLSSIRDGEIQSVFDLAIIILDQCSRTFFDRTQPTDLQPLVLDSFGNAIGKITYKQTIAFDHFWECTATASNVYNTRDEYETAAMQKRLLDINPEGILLREIRDVLDELYIITLIKNQQITVAKSFIKLVRQILNPRAPRTPRISSITFPRSPSPSELTLPENIHRPSFDTERFEPMDWTAQYSEDLLERMQDQRVELEYLREAAQHTSNALNDLLALKQQQAGVVEAREAVKQAQETLKQGRSIMLFTIVTIVFLPLSFFSSIFGMNSAEFNNGNWSVSEEIIYMFPVSLVIIVASLLIAFSNTTRAILSYICTVSWVWFTTTSPLYIWWHGSHIDSKKLRADERKIIAKMKADAWRKRLEREKAKEEKKAREEEEKAKEEEKKLKALNPASMEGRMAINGDLEMGTMRRRP